MASVWIRVREVKGGRRRYRVEFRPGGRGARIRYAGSFVTKREARLRRDYVAGELAAKRMPDLRLLAGPPSAPTFGEAAAAWRESRIDVADGTAVYHRAALGRALPFLRERRVDAITAEDMAALVVSLHEQGKAPATIRKTRDVVAMVLDHARVSPNPARDKIAVRLPREEPEEVAPPIAEHVEAVFHLLPRRHRLALLFLDWSGARVSAIDTTLVGDYDEQRKRVRLRAATTKTRRALWIELHPALADALERELGPREDRDRGARLFAASGADALRTAIGKACKAAGVPLFSPHDLRHRRISLLHLRGVPWARIAESVGQRKLSVTADTYSHVLVDERELDYAEVLR